MEGNKEKVEKKTPLIKEYRIDRIKRCLKCIDEYPFDRDKQKECVLDLYPDKEGKSPEHREKSIFRGMVVPSLRSLGLIMGYGDYIRLSANAKLIVESESMGDELHRRVLRAVISEIDENRFQFTDILLREAPISMQRLLSLVDIRGLSERQKRERIKKWCSILEQVGLVIESGEQLSMDLPKRKEVLLDTDIGQKDAEVFKKYLFCAYRELGKETAGIVSIADLRVKVAMEALKSGKAILTESQFDEMLRNVRFATDDYIISLGRPMGAEEKLFKYREEYYRTLSIKNFRR